MILEIAAKVVAAAFFVVVAAAIAWDLYRAVRQPHAATSSGQKDPLD